MAKLRNRRSLLRLAGALVAGSAVGAPAVAQLRSGENPDASENWQKIRASLFQSRPIRADAEDLLVLDAPARAEDAAVVPLAVQTKPAASAASSSRIRKLWLIVDQNPSPIAGIFDFGPRSARADIETRVRIDEYSFVRAVAETEDGRLHMSTRFVKASGGCSAPPGKDPAAALASLGRMRLRIEGDAAARQPVLAQLMISHPNHSGMAMDQLTRQYTPAHFVREVKVTLGGEPVLDADLDFAISENPNLRFWLLPDTPGGELRVDVVDSKEQHFDTALKLGGAQG